jgi:pyruvate/2-oxoglutarate dehydrogenase complex dihydrolipoamide dehydrogenase (E3) component/uncharacterized membrane protein YdjX (TVP38/TMEM64 family)
MKIKRYLLFLVIALAVTAFFFFGLDDYLSLELFQSRKAQIDAYVEDYPWRVAAVYFLVYVAVTALSLPGALVMTLVGGALFGLLWGSVIISFASSIGATLAFLASRFLFRDWVQDRFGARLAPINRGMAREGALYLFGLRLVPIFPFFVINLVMGLTSIRTFTFYWVSQVGMIPATLVFVNAGTQIAAIESASGILSPPMLLSLALLGVFPLLARRFLAWLEARRLLAPWPRPRCFDRNLVVIGAGSAGLVTAYIAAAVKAKVTLVEKHRMGGDCLNTGCVPSKTLLRTARFLAEARRSRELGIRETRVDFDFADVMERVSRVVKTIEPHDSVERYRGLGVDTLIGAARITSPYEVAVETAEGTRSLTTRAIVIASGARPLVPPIPGIEEVGYRTSDDIWDLRALPRRLLVLGGGPIGCELAQAFARFGARVTLVEMAPCLLPREDPAASSLLSERFRAEGIDLRTGHRAERFALESGERALYAAGPDGEARLPFDLLLCALGRVPNTQGFGLEELGIPLTSARTVETNAYLQTLYPNIYACGDVAGPYQFTHTASHQAWYAAVNALFGRIRRFRVDYSVIPWTIFTDPEIARVGVSEEEARERGMSYEVCRYDLSGLDRAIADGEARGIVKILTAPGRDRILGATIVGSHAGELIAELVLAMKHGIGLNKLLGTIHVYPTWAEANRHVAGAWKRAHAPLRLLAWLERYHGWNRR